MSHSFRGGDSLLRMLASHEQLVARTPRRIADAGTDRLERNTKRRTPIDTNPFRDRPGRPRGYLRDSVHRLEGVRFEQRGAYRVWQGTVVSYDPVARLVEFDTPPHTIRAADGGFLRFRSRDGWVDKDGRIHPPGTWVTVREVQHPGTKGQHMFSLGALATELDFAEFAGPELARWSREVRSGRFR